MPHRLLAVAFETVVLRVGCGVVAPGVELVKLTHVLSIRDSSPRLSLVSRRGWMIGLNVASKNTSFS
eukprot:SAG11_NODE_20481_length_444_cov_0.985507_1_plen_66_part_01